MSWSSDVIGCLRVLKTAGYTFEESWATAVSDFPPRGREFGAAVRSMDDVRADRDSGIEAYDEFLRRVCEDAWKGRRPRLRFLGDALAGGFVADDRSGFAVKNGRMTNQAAA